MKFSGIAGKFIAVFSVITLLMLGMVAVGVIMVAKSSQAQVADSVLRTLEGNQQVQADALSANLADKGELAANLLADNAAQAIYNFDYESLQHLADNAMRSSDIKTALYYDVDGNLLTFSDDMELEGQKVTRDIVIRSEESASIAMELLQQSEGMHDAVAFFRLAHQAGQRTLSHMPKPLQAAAPARPQRQMVEDSVVKETQVLDEDFENF